MGAKGYKSSDKVKSLLDGTFKPKPTKWANTIVRLRETLGIIKATSVDTDMHLGSSELAMLPKGSPERLQAERIMKEYQERNQ